MAVQERDARRFTPRESIGGEERCEATFENEEAARRRERWAGDRRELTDELRARREARSLARRLADAVARASAVSTLAAARIEKARPGTDHPGGGRPPGESDARIGGVLTRVRNIITDLELALDEEEGIAPARNLAAASTVEKDRELLTAFAGVPASQVARDRPDLGSRATVYRKRRGAELDGLGLHDGAVPDTAFVAAALKRMHARGLVPP